MRYLAPAKINLYLHVTGRHDDGYHAIDFLAGFTDFGDEISVEHAEELTLEITGRFAKHLAGEVVEENLVVRAARAVAGLAGQAPNVKITLKKNLPIGAGIGGGSSDAAATVHALLKLWGIKPEQEKLDTVLLSLGADVPVCYYGISARGAAAHVRGIGQEITPVDIAHDIPVVLIYSGAPCATPDVFAAYNQEFGKDVDVPVNINNFEDCVEFLLKQSNDLYETACGIVPDINQALTALAGQSGCVIARMSGAGSACFGVFEDIKMAQNTAFVLKINHPNWWVQAGVINRSATTL